MQLILDFGVNVNKAIDIMSMDLTSDPIFAGAYGVVQTIADSVIAPATGVIVGICFFIEFIKTTMRMDVLKFENAIAALFKFVFAKAAIDIAPRLVLGFYEMGSDWVTQTAGRGVDSEIQLKDFTQTLASEMNRLIGTAASDFEWYQSLALCAVLGIVFLSVMIIGVIVVVMAYARSVEILLYIAVAPLPCSFVLMDNGQVTKRFLLQFLGVVLQGVLMLIIILIFQSMMTHITAEMSSSIGSTPPMTIGVWGTGTFGVITKYCSLMMIATITLLAAIMKSGSLAKQMLSG
jgi:hypothetical protein